MPDEPELGAGAAPVKVEKPGRKIIPARRKEPKKDRPLTTSQAESKTVHRRPSIRERFAERRRMKRLEREPAVRQYEVERKTKEMKLRGAEMDVRREQRQQRIRRVKESRVGYGISVVGRGARPVVRSGVRTFRRAERRGLGITPQTAYGTGLTGIGSQQRYGAPRSGLSALPAPIPIHSMSSISSGGAVSRFEPQRQERKAVPRGTIKSYWSKKVKSLARSNVRKYGSDEGIDRTRQMASELGWKMQ